MTNFYWWWIQSGSLFTAYLFGCCIIAAMIVYRLNELYLDETRPKKWVIHWRSLITGATGHGTEGFKRELAESWIDDLNRDSKGLLVHWIEQEK